RVAFGDGALPRRRGDPAGPNAFGADGHIARVEGTTVRAGRRRVDLARRGHLAFREAVGSIGGGRTFDDRRIEIARPRVRNDSVLVAAVRVAGRDRGPM